jgi:multiple sugar transport system ATP-binding protein
VARILLDEVTKVFGSEVVAVDHVSLEVADGEFMVLVGPSGCGKSTLLRIIAGLEELSTGEVVIGDSIVTDMSPRDRDIAMVFQNYALYPHMSVEQNLGLGLKLRGAGKAERKAKVDEVAQVLGLDTLLGRKPAQLSGGQRQRVAMGRAMVREPQAFLMDEPLSNLDAKLRVQMRAELARLRDRLKTTTVYVTHDQVEAMTLGDRVAVMRDGLLQQVDTPQKLYRNPSNLFVAAFIGSPSMNLVEAEIGNGRVRFGGFDLPAPSGRGLESYEGGTLILGIRPSDFEDASTAHNPDLPTIEVVVDVIEELGSEVHLLFTVAAAPVAADVRRAAADAEKGDDVLLVHDDDHANRTPFTARVSAATTGRPGNMVKLTVDPEAFHFFDPSSGASLAHRVEAAVA